MDIETLHDRPGHLGLTAMHDRASISGGWLHLHSAPGEGTELQLWVPLRPEGETGVPEAAGAGS